MPDHPPTGRQNARLVRKRLHPCSRTRRTDLRRYWTRVHVGAMYLEGGGVMALERRVWCAMYEEERGFIFHANVLEPTCWKTGVCLRGEEEAEEMVLVFIQDSLDSPSLFLLLSHSLSTPSLSPPSFPVFHTSSPPPHSHGISFGMPI